MDFARVSIQTDDPNRFPSLHGDEQLSCMSQKPSAMDRSNNLPWSDGLLSRSWVIPPFKQQLRVLDGRGPENHGVSTR